MLDLCYAWRHREYRRARAPRPPFVPLGCTVHWLWVSTSACGPTTTRSICLRFSRNTHSFKSEMQGNTYPKTNLWTCCTEKWSLGNIADVVRYRSAKTDNLHRGAWVIGLDTWWLRQPTAANSPSSTGHIMATCAARNRRANDNLHWEFMYLSKPEERTRMLPPVYFPRGSVVLQEIQNTCMTLARRQKCIQRCRATSN